MGSEGTKRCGIVGLIMITGIIIFLTAGVVADEIRYLPSRILRMGKEMSMIRRVLICLMIAATIAAILVAYAPGAEAQTTVDISKARLTWSWAQGTGGMVAAFRVKCGPTSGSEAILVSIPDPLARQVLVSAVVTSPGKYYCRVTAANAFGESGVSNEVFFDAGLSPSSPTGLLLAP